MTLLIPPSETGSATTSLRSSILDYRQENGRTYHKYEDGRYILPNDEMEKDRLDLQHHMSLLTLDNKLHLAPIPEKVGRVLDVGTGTGIWAIDFADAHESAMVVGVDLSPIQPPFVPPNLTFEVDDVEKEWTFEQPFEFIHARMLMGSIRDWPKLFKQCFTGWMELHDMKFPIQCDDGSLTNDHAVYKWSSLMVEGMAKATTPITVTDRNKEWMKDAGFTDVKEVVYKWPISPWPKAEKEKRLGLWEQVNFLDGIHGFTMAIFTRLLRWSAEEVEVFMASVRKDIKDTKIHAYFPIYVTYGQKPGEKGTES
ncbi:MAG: hypothetical protein M1817_005117 [Caeruleum heppii]|nr:MAG: hypothetical protein M1817_005117 [Caeruleum heppii]